MKISFVSITQKTGKFESNPTSCKFLDQGTYTEPDLSQVIKVNKNLVIST